MPLVSLVRREIPKILGSSTGFIVLIVVLVVLITVSLSAIIYLLRQERIGDQQARRRRRYNAQPLLDRDLSNPRHSKKWYSYLWGSRDRHNHAQFKSMERNEESWNIQANSRVDDSAEDCITPCSDNQSGLLRNGSSASFSVGPRFYTHHMQTPTSDDASSVLYDPHDVRGLPYPGQFPVSPQATIPSIPESQINSSSLSSPFSPVPRRIMKSPEPISSTISLDSVRDSLSQLAAPVLASGSKFFESL